MAFCVSDKTIPAATITYDDSGCLVREPRRHRLAPDVQTGYPLYGQDGDKSGFYLVVPQAATNFTDNPSFFNNLESWTPNDVLGVRTNEWAFDSGFSLRLTGNGDTTDPGDLRSYMETEITGFVNGLIYTASVYAWQNQIYDVIDDVLSDIFMGTISIVQQVRDVDDNVITETEVVSDRLSKVRRWERLAVSTTIADDTTHVLVRLNLRSEIKRYTYPPFDPILDEGGNQIFNSTDEYIYFDMVQFENGRIATTPFHGDTQICGNQFKGDCGEYTWLGVPHCSASFRSGCARDGGVLVSLSDLGFQLLSHGGHDGMPVTNLAQPYANKPGSNYQKSLLAPSRTLTFNTYDCTCSLTELECDIFKLQNLTMPEVGGCSGLFLLVYMHDPDFCQFACDADRALAMCVAYRGGFEYTRNNLYQQRMVLQFETFDPLAWFRYPGNQSIGLNFVEAISGNRVIKIEQEGGYTTFPIEQNKDFRSIACMPGTNDFVVAGEFEGINVNDENENVSLFSCNESCTLQTGGFGDTVNVAKHTQNGDVYIGGAFAGNLSIIRAKNGAQGSFIGYPGGEVFSLDKPFWGEIIAGTDTAIHMGFSDNTWQSYATDGGVRDIQTDSFGNVYVVGDFTTINGEAFNRVARFNVNVTGCLDVENGTWESIGYGFDGQMNTITVDPTTGAVYFGGLADNATPDQVDICNEVAGRSTDSKGRGVVCNAGFSDDACDFVTGANPQTIFGLGQGGILSCDIRVDIESDGTIGAVACPGQPTITMTGAGTLLRINFEFPVENIVVTLNGVDTGEFFQGFNVLPDTVTGDFTLNGNIVNSGIAGGTGTLEWNGPLSEIIIGYDRVGAFDDIINFVSLAFTPVTNGNNQQFRFEDLGGGETRLGIALSNPIAREFLDECINTQPITAGLQKRYVRITASNSQGINYNFLLGDDNILASGTSDRGGMYVYNIRVDTNATFPTPCDELNTTFRDEFNQTLEDLQLYQTLTLNGGPGIDNLLSTIKIQCITLDEIFQGDDIVINHIACLSGQNLTDLGDGFTTEVYDLIIPETGELWAGYDGGLRIWNGQEWFDFPGILSGSVIDMDVCPNSCDIYILTDADGAHVMPGITEIDYFGNFENTNAKIQIHGPGNFEYMFEHCTDKQARFCAAVECDSVASLNVGQGTITGSRDYNSTVLSGSRLDFFLRKCGQVFSMYIEEDLASTKATLVFNEYFWGINAACCSGKGNGANGGGYIPLPPQDEADCCETNHDYNMHRNPTDEDCITEGWNPGDQWLNVANNCAAPALFVNTGAGCNEACGIDAGGLIDGDGGIVLDQDGNPICPS